MRRTDPVLIAGLATTLAVGAAISQAGELQLRAVPKPIMQSVTTRFKSAKFMGAAKETSPEGVTIFEVTLTEKGKNIDLTLTPAGAITLIEKEIDRKALPKGASDTLNARYPRARYQIVEEIYTVAEGKETLTSYEAVLLDPQKQVWAVELGLDGKVVKVENKTGVVD